MSVVVNDKSHYVILCYIVLSHLILRYIISSQITSYNVLSLCLNVSLQKLFFIFQSSFYFLLLGSFIIIFISYNEYKLIKKNEKFIRLFHFFSHHVSL